MYVAWFLRWLIHAHAYFFVPLDGPRSFYPNFIRSIFIGKYEFVSYLNDRLLLDTGRTAMLGKEPVDNLNTHVEYGLVLMPFGCNLL